MSKIAIIGATGRVGHHLMEEALRRGHTITALARNATGKAAGHPSVTARDVDVQNAEELERAVTRHDAVFSAARFKDVPPRAIIDPVKRAPVMRLLVVGGAASLLVPSGQRLLDTPTFPSEHRAEAAAGVNFLETLRQEKELDWTFVSPSALFIEGPRTGQFRLGNDELLVDAGNKSWISFADYAIAFLDEFEQHAHSRRRFTVGY